jgi:hypothetical protein
MWDNKILMEIILEIYRNCVFRNFKRSPLRNAVVARHHL